MTKAANIFALFFLLFLPRLSWAQDPTALEIDGEFEVGGDIFQDFNEDLEATQVAEDERFYRYGRFFGVNIGMGLTSFQGKRGAAYQNSFSNGPSWNLSVMYFRNFQTAFLVGLAYSQHTAFIDTHTRGSPSEEVGAIRTSMLRPYFGFRYYIDTSDLGTAITYANPYLAMRMEYWYQTNEFTESKNLSDETGGGMGTAIGFGLEFPMELRKSYFNIEFLYHSVNFFDKYTNNYQQISYGPDDSETAKKFPSEYGFDNLTGDVITIMFSHNTTW